MTSDNEDCICGEGFTAGKIVVVVVVVVVSSCFLPFASALISSLSSMGFYRNVAQSWPLLFFRRCSGGGDEALNGYFPGHSDHRYSQQGKERV